jgi:hypothetical protein
MWVCDKTGESTGTHTGTRGGISGTSVSISWRSSAGIEMSRKTQSKVINRDQPEYNEKTNDE